MSNISTDKKHLARLRSFLRNDWRRYNVARKEALENACVRERRKLKSGKLSVVSTIKGYVCSKCGRLAHKKLTKVHHATPVGKLEFTKIHEWDERLNCDVSDLVVLCEDCHKKEHGSKK